MPKPQAAIFAEPGRHQWYVHLSRLSRESSEAALVTLRTALGELRRSAEQAQINLVIGFGPSLLTDLSGDLMLALTPQDFQPYETITSADGSDRQAIGTQEELLIWLTHADTDVVWKAQYDFRTAVAEHFEVARETPAFVLGPSLDMTGFADGIGNSSPASQQAVALVPPGEPGAGGSHVIAQRWAQKPARRRSSGARSIPTTPSWPSRHRTATCATWSCARTEITG